MSLRGAVYDLLNDVETDVHPLVAPQETTVDYATYKMSFDYDRDQTGIFQIIVALTINIYSDTLANAVTLANSFYSGLNGKSGTYDSESLFSCLIESESDDYIPDLDKYNITQEYTLKFE